MMQSRHKRSKTFRFISRKRSIVGLNSHFNERQFFVKVEKQKFAHTLAHVATVIRRVTYKNVIVEEFIAATTWPPIHNKADVNVITYVKRNYLL